MDAQLVPILVDLPHDVWMALHNPPDQKECGAHLVPRQCFQHARRIGWVRTVVERQRDLAARPVSMPKNGRITRLLEAIEAKKKG